METFKAVDCQGTELKVGDEIAIALRSGDSAHLGIRRIVDIRESKYSRYRHVTNDDGTSKYVEYTLAELKIYEEAKGLNSARWTPNSDNAILLRRPANDFEKLLARSQQGR